MFDIDGTLVDSNEAHARAWVKAFAGAGVLVEFEKVRCAIGMGGDKLMPAQALSLFTMAPGFCSTGWKTLRS